MTSGPCEFRSRKNCRNCDDVPCSLEHPGSYNLGGEPADFIDLLFADIIEEMFQEVIPLVPSEFPETVDASTDSTSKPRG